MKGIVVSSNGSGGGKTTVTLGLMKLLKNRGFSVQGYKVGPDYIDTAFHSRITGMPSRNLDLFLMGEDGVKASFSRGNGDYAIIEGVMGLYDGKGIDSKYSTAHLAKELNLPVVLVLSPKAKVATLCAEIKGILDFENVNIVGVIFNNISESYFKLLKGAVEKLCNTKVFGYIPKDDYITLNSRHLGLVQSSEIEKLEEKIDYCASLMEKFLNVDELLKEFKKCNTFIDKYHLEPKNINIAIAKDKAFSFYYRENIELLEEVGNVVYFSPIEDKELPKNIDLIYLGGGYPEVFPQELSQNKSMLQSIKNALNNGTRCYAECGGLMYLMSNISIDENEIVKKYNMVDFFKGTVSMTKRLQNFGYGEVEVFKENKVIKNGITINCHEFHKSKIDSEDLKVYSIKKTLYDGTIRKWQCGYTKKNTLGAYAHLHFFGNMDFIKELIKINKGRS